MNRAKELLFTLMVMLLVFSSCKKEHLDDGGNGNPNGPVTSAIVVGRIINDMNQPIQGATIKVGANITTTDVNGNFRIEGSSINNNVYLVTAEKAGYFGGSRTLVARQNQKHYAEIMLLPKQIVGTIYGSTGGNIALGNGSSLTLQPSGVVTASTGAVYTGSINVAMTWIDPTSNDLYRQMPGDLIGKDSAGTDFFLQSFGMLGVELTGNSGEKLQIASGKKADLKFPLPTTVQAAAPSTIALWSFNDSTGLWKKEGTAIKNGNYYSASVSHFSWWNCDANFPLASFSATFVNSSGQPLQHFPVRIKRANGSARFAYTDSSGFVQGQIPSNEPLVLEVLSTYNCSSAIYTNNIGPFATNSSNPLGQLQVSFTGSNVVTITGTVVNCNNLPVSNGYVQAKVGASIYRAILASNGTFSLPFSSCSAGSQVSYYAVDNTANQQSNVVNATFPFGTNPVGTIKACGTSTTTFINYNLDGVNYSIVPPADSISVTPQVNTAFTLTVRGYHNNTSPFGFYVNDNILGPTTAFLPTIPSFVVPSSSGQILCSGVITENGNYVAGSFAGTEQNFTANVTHTFQCTFRVKR